MDINFKSFANEIHNNNVQKGFYDEKRETGTLLMLIVSELAEAMEADRKNKKANRQISWENFDFSKQYDRDIFENNIKNSFEDEIADTIIRLFDLVGYMGIDIDWHIKQKLEYNKTRPYKHGKNY